MQSSHADFGQAGYSQQYAFPQSLPSIPSNQGHDMNKQVAAGQSGMYSTSAGMPAPVQHHQSAMGGPVPSPQPTSLVQPMPQMNRVNPGGMQTFYRNAPSRQVTNMSRNALTAVVNQTGQQPSSQYTHAVQMVQQSPSYLQMIPNQYPMVNFPGRAPQYGPQYQLISPGQQQFYLNNYIGHNQTQTNTNGYQYHNPIPNFNAVPAQMPQQPIPNPQPPQQQQQPKRTKALLIVNPETGKSIFDDQNAGSGTRPSPEKETENNDPNVGVEFAKQVALTLNRSEPSSKPVDDPRIMDSQIVMCPSDVGSISGVEESDMSELGDREDPGELGDTESICEIEYIESHSVSHSKEPTVILYKKDIEPISINDSMYVNDMTTSQVNDSVPVGEFKDLAVFDMMIPQQPEVEVLVKTESVKNIQVSSVPEKNVGSFEIPEVPSELSIEPEYLKAPIDVVQPVMAPTSVIKEESKIPNSSVELSEVTASIQKIPDKSPSIEGKKNKAKKEKGL